MTNQSPSCCRSVARKAASSSTSSSTSACSTSSSTSACSTTSTSACSATSTSGSLVATWSAETSEVHWADTLMTYFLTACGYVPDVALRDVTYRMGKCYLPNARETSLTNTWSKLHTRPMTTETKTITTEVYVTSSCRVGRTTLRSSSRI